jgi:hypothetical protein
MKFRTLAGVSALALSVVSGASAAVINVPGDIASLSVAVAVAADGDEIVIAGSAAPYLVFPGLVVTNKTLTIRGATGNPADVVIDGAGLDIVLRITGTGSDGTVLEALTIQNGRGGTATNSSGAGVFINGANVTIRDCVIRNNVIPAPDGNGAGLYATVSDVEIQRCVIEGNSMDSASGDGVGAYFNGGFQRITDTIFRDNRIAGAGELGLSAVGGGIYADVGSMLVTRCLFEGNRTGFGGGVAVIGNMQSVTIDECEFVDNEARNGGGFGANSTAGPLVPRIRNSLFVGNMALNDSAIYTDKGGFFTNLTMAGNISSGSYVVGGSSPTGTTILDNSIIWGNTYNEANGPIPTTTPDVVRWCILQDAYTGAAGSLANRVIDPMFVDPSNRDFRLMPMSPAIDAGDTNLYFGPFADLDGAPRVVDVPEVADTGFTLSGPVIDIGAYEFQVGGPVDTCPTDTNGDGVINFVDLNAVLSVFGTDCD